MTGKPNPPKAAPTHDATIRKLYAQRATLLDIEDTAATLTREQGEMLQAIADAIDCLERAERDEKTAKDRIAELEREVAQLRSQAATNGEAHYQATHCRACGRTLWGKCSVCEDR